MKVNKHTNRQVYKLGHVCLFTCLRFYFSQMRRFPFFDDVREGQFHFIFVEREPAQLRADGLFFEFGASPHEGRADNADDDRAPVVLSEERSKDKNDADSHHVGPAKITEGSFAANDKRKAKSDDGEGDDADEDAEKIHSGQLSVGSYQWCVFHCVPVYLSTCVPVYLNICLHFPRFAFQQILGCCMQGGVCQKTRVARVVRVSRGVSVLDAIFLTIDFECVPKQGDAEDAQSG